MHFYSDHPQYVLGFHGCEKSVRDKVLNSDHESLKVSDNDYDWLGSGIYFWLNDPIRALEWANRTDKAGKKILKEPAVIGAIIDLKTCLNLSEYECIQTLKLGYDLLNKTPKIKELVNKAPDKGGFDLLRPLDCAVINYTYQILLDKGTPFDTVMGYFQEDEPAFPGAGIRKKSHIQICVRNPECILGYFLPRKQEE